MGRIGNIVTLISLCPLIDYTFPVFLWWGYLIYVWLFVYSNSFHFRGKFATVRRCRHISSGKDYAAKYLKKRRRSENVRHELIHEACVLALADSCHRIVGLKEVFETEIEIILVLEM